MVQKHEQNKICQADRDKQQKALDAKKVKDMAWKQSIQEKHKHEEAQSLAAHEEGLKEDVREEERKHEAQKEWRKGMHERTEFLKEVKEKKEAKKKSIAQEEEEKKEKAKARKEYFDELHKKGGVQKRMHIIEERTKVEEESKKHADLHLSIVLKEIGEKRTLMLLHLSQEEQMQKNAIQGELARKRHETEGKLQHDLATLERDRKLALSRMSSGVQSSHQRSTTIDVQREYERQRLEAHTHAQHEKALLEGEAKRKLSVLHGETDTKRMGIEEEIRKEYANAEHLAQRKRDEAEMKTRMAEERDAQIAHDRAMDVKFVKGEES